MNYELKRVSQLYGQVLGMVLGDEVSTRAYLVAVEIVRPSYFDGAG